MDFFSNAFIDKVYALLRATNISTNLRQKKIVDALHKTIIDWMDTMNDSIDCLLWIKRD